MLTPVRSKPVIILEGPDGAGKTTLAHKLADRLGARYVHLGPMTNVKDLGRIYVEAMLPAIQGYQTVIMDRAWFSEEPYGTVFREGKLRNDSVIDAMLERLVLSCTGVVIYCDTDPKRLVESFTSRKGQEYLDRADQMLAVARAYRDRMGRTELSMFRYDYASDDVDSITQSLKFQLDLQSPHYADWESTGNLNGSVLLVGEGYTDHQNTDNLLQRPFVSFARNGSSYWLTRQLQVGEIPERELCWINQDRDPAIVYDLLSAMFGNLKLVACLGAEASKTMDKNFASELRERGIRMVNLPHPQHHRRFKHHEPYPLIDIIKESI